MIGYYFGRPAAIAEISGGELFPNLHGTVQFYNTNRGTIVAADVSGLPPDMPPCNMKIFGFHIHEGFDCSGVNFENTGGHFNPNGCTHPNHAGDLPPLFNADGKAFMIVLTNRFKVWDIIGRTIVIHSSPDDFTSQPSGNSGEKIACGVIRLN